ncbi:MAG: alginate lyase family protein [Bacteroidaceae bacterium]|nr:alginate lyase family protein [Bacteroidaceae bacterium]
MKRSLLLLFVALAAISGQAQIIWDLPHLERVKAAIDEPYYAAAYGHLLDEANACLEAKPLSVMDKKDTPASGDRHDYMSLARYYWPDPSKPDGLPYVNRDGISNPELNAYDRVPLGQTCQRVETLALAWYLSGNEAYARKAVEFVRVFFLDKATRMNPNLNYAQVAKGHNEGRGRSFGVLDAYSLVGMLDGLLLMEYAKAAPLTKRDTKAMRDWIMRLRKWIMESEFGKTERAGKNNHSTCCDLMLAAFSLYLDDTATARQILSEVPARRIDTQIKGDGSQPFELGRTLSFHYSIYNLGFMADLCQMAHRVGLSLERHTGPDGQSLFGALNYLLPYAGKDISAWPYKQLGGWDGEQRTLLRLLYRFGHYTEGAPASYISTYQQLRKLDMKNRFHLLWYDASLTDHAYLAAVRQLSLSVDEARTARRSKENRAAGRVIARSEGKDGQFILVNANDWCSGFVPGSLWMMYQYTHDRQWREEAASQTWLIEDAKWNKGTHDLGFMINNSFGKGFEITGEESMLDVMLHASRTLTTRFNPTVGCIRSWDHNKDKWLFPVIIDNMMNLEMLFRATQLSGDSTFWKIAVSHANTTMKNHFRPDNSSYHVIDYDPATGQVRKRNTAQGNSDDSFWSRGQAWGLYGFTLAYRFTRDPRYLAQAEAIADLWLSWKHLPADGVPYWDMKLPEYTPSTERDASAGAISASALYELAGYASAERAARYLAQADLVTESLYRHYRAPEGTHHGFLLLHSVGSRPANSEVDVPLNYADYYYLEAMQRRAALGR